MSNQEGGRSGDAPAGEVDRLTRENELLSQQVRRLIKAEGRLYALQEELDRQLREYMELYELSKRIAAATDIARVIRYTLEYVVQKLEYEKAIYLSADDGGPLLPHDSEGYYDPDERESVQGCVLAWEDLILGPLLRGADMVIISSEEESEGIREWCRHCGMDEFLLYPLGPRKRPLGFLMVGNSASKAPFFRRVEDTGPSLFAMGNLVSLISSSLENLDNFRRLEQALEQERVAEEKYRSIFENSIDGIFRRNHTRYLDVNPAMAAMLGYDSPADLVESVTDIATEVYADQERHAELLRLLDQSGAVSGFETQVCRKDGKVIWMSVNASATRDAEGALLYYEGTAENIEQRKEAEEALKESEQAYRELSRTLEQRVFETVAELRQKDKMLIIQSRQAVMGEMINNIAHQWRQPLNMLALLVQELPVRIRREPFDPEYVDDNVSKSMELIRHMSKTIDDFRNFFRSDQNRVEFEVTEVIKTTVSLLKGSLDSLKIDVQIQTVGNPTIVGYPNEFSQVMVNLLQNARDAFAKTKVEQPQILISVSEIQGKTVVTVGDNAGGIPEEIIEKVFEPYFTTKGPEQGTGIGLFMSKTIIEKHMKGTLAVRNVGGGAEFRIVI